MNKDLGIKKDMSIINDFAFYSRREMLEILFLKNENGSYYAKDVETQYRLVDDCSKLSNMQPR